jgi:hypothetical protein
MRKALIALAIGTVLRLALLGLAAAADSAGLAGLADTLFWQNGLMQYFAPLQNIGTPERPIYEGTPINFLAFLASIPLGIVIYSLAAYVALQGFRRGA